MNRTYIQIIYSQTEYQALARTLTKETDEDTGVVTFDVVRGLQAEREFYVAMVSFSVVAEYFKFSDNSMEPKERAQRKIKNSRIAPITKYIQDNPKEYVFSSVTVSIDSNLHFEVMPGLGEYGKLGTLKIPMNAKLLINDGQHRCQAIKNLIEQNSSFRNEKIPVVFFRDRGLKRSQQMFADLNKHAIKPTKSLGLFYDHRDPFARFLVTLTQDVEIFRDRTAMEESNIAPRSKMLFSLNGIGNATRYLLRLKTKSISKEKQSLAAEFWKEVAKNIPEWQALLNEEPGFSPTELRKNYVHAHANILNALGLVGWVLTTRYNDWKKRLKNLQNIPWNKDHKLWQGNIVIEGTMIHKKIVISQAADIILSKCKAVSLEKAGIQ